MKKNVLIVGAGLGGLSTALRLATQGYQVEIIEKNSQAGGRLNQIKKDGFTFDTGPSFFSMSYEFKELAKDCNIELPFKFVELDPLYTVNFSDSKKTWFLYKDIKQLAEQFKEVEPDFEQKMERYLKKSGALFNDTVDLVIKNNFDSIFGYIFTLMRVNPIHIPVLFRSFYQEIQRNFDSKEAQQILSLVAFFLGRTPFDTMAIYTLLSYTEFKHDGYFNVEGGMYKIVEGLVEELKKAGVKITYNTEIVDCSVSKNELDYLIDKEGNRWSSESYVINGDAAFFRGRIFKRKRYSDLKLDKMSWTMGYLTIYLGISQKLPHVHYHNYYLGANFEEYANSVSDNSTALEKPYYYVNVLSKYNNNCAPQGCESLFIVCPVPNLKHKSDWSDRDLIVDSIIEDFSTRIGTDIMPLIISRTVYTPLEWQNQFNLFRGAGLGLSHDFTQIGALRPSNFDEKFKNVFYVGASTAPGAGLPMAVISSNLAYERVVKYANS